MHTHLLPERLPRFAEKFGYGDFIHLEHNRPGVASMMKGGVFFREIEQNCWDPALAHQRIRPLPYTGASGVYGAGDVFLLGQTCRRTGIVAFSK